MPSAPAAAIARADEASAPRSLASNSATVLVISAGSRPARSQCRSSTSNLRRTSLGSPNTLHAFNDVDINLWDGTIPFSLYLHDTRARSEPSRRRD